MSDAEILEFDNYKNIKLLKSCYLNNIHEVYLLIDDGVNVTYEHNGETALLKSCEAIIDANNEIDVSINIEIVTLLIECGEYVNYENCDGKTPLYVALKSKKYALAKFLIENGADINYENIEGFTVLMYMCEKNDVESAEFLLEMGADVNYISKNNNTALLLAFGMGINSDIDDKTLNDDLVKLLVNNGADISHKDCNKKSVFYTIFEKYDSVLIEYLFDLCDDIECVDVYGNTILMWCCYYDNIDSVKFLAEKGANIEHITPEGYTPLIWCCCYDYMDLVEFFVEGGANINYVYDECYTPLIYACIRENVEMVKYLLENGANPNYSNKHGYTPLIYACINGNIEVVKLLMNYNVDINYVNKDKDCALTYACINDRDEIVKLILKRSVCIKHNVNYNMIFITLGYLRRFNIITILLCAGYSYKDLSKSNNFKIVLPINNYLEHKRVSHTGFYLDNNDEHITNIDKIISLEIDCEKNVIYNGLKRELREPISSDIFSYMVLISDGYYSF